MPYTSTGPAMENILALMPSTNPSACGQVGPIGFYKYLHLIVVIV